jgi:hypothetical protein
MYFRFLLRAPVSSSSLFHVSDSDLGFYITCITTYPELQSEYRFVSCPRLGSVPPLIELRSILDSTLAPSTLVLPRAALSRQAPCLVAKLPGNLLFLHSSLHSPARIPSGQKPYRQEERIVCTAV